jgi:ribosome recycling factor
VSEHDVSRLKRRMEGALEVLKKELGGLRTGRASANLLEPVQVPAYGSTMPMSQVGTVGVPEPRLLTVQVWDKSLVQSVDKAIRDAGLGLNPQIEGSLIRVRIPELSLERRQELAKIAHKYTEQARVAVRNVRRDGMEFLKRQEKDHKISEDEHRHQSDQTQKLTDDTIKKIEDILAIKEKEIMQV